MFNALKEKGTVPNQFFVYKFADRFLLVVNPSLSMSDRQFLQAVEVAGAA